jgi:sec-independent protein translocase protein TatC
MSAAPAAASQTPDDQELDGRARMFSIIERLEEFRLRLIRSFIAVLVGIGIALAFLDQIVAFVLSPAVRLLPPGSHFIYTEPTEAFALHFNIAIIAGCVFAAPYIMYQLWLLLAPMLGPEQKKFMVPFVLLTSLGVIGGATFSHFIVFPYMIAFFGTFTTGQLQFMPKIRDSFDLYIKMLMGMTLVFQIPTLAFFLAKMGLVTAGLLWKNTRYAILIAFVLGAVLTPSGDPWNQTVFAAPIVILYLISIGIAWLVAPRKTQAASDAESDSNPERDADSDSDHES